MESINYLAMSIIIGIEQKVLLFDYLIQNKRKKVMCFGVTISTLVVFGVEVLKMDVAYKILVRSLLIKLTLSKEKKIKVI